MAFNFRSCICECHTIICLFEFYPKPLLSPKSHFFSLTIVLFKNTLSAFLTGAVLPVKVPVLPASANFQRFSLSPENLQRAEVPAHLPVLPAWRGMGALKGTGPGGVTLTFSSSPRPPPPFSHLQPPPPPLSLRWSSSGGLPSDLIQGDRSPRHSLPWPPVFALLGLSLGFTC